MLAGIVMAGLALVGLSYVTTLGAFYLFYAFNALGYVCGGPLPNQVLLSRWFDQARQGDGHCLSRHRRRRRPRSLLAFALTGVWVGAARCACSEF